MNKGLAETIATIKLGGVQQVGQFAVLPIVEGPEKKIEYISLRAAMAEECLEVTEINAGGSVPSLRLKSTSELPVLVLDGEELAGAKQNRIANATILVPAKTEMRIPVSCTEAGRWSYESPAFSDSDEVLAYKARHNKFRAVDASLKGGRGYQSNQGKVWEDIEDIQSKMGVHSRTGALKDVYSHRRREFRHRSEQFGLVEGQRGIVFFLNGHPLGAEYVSSPEVYRDLHQKLLRSYMCEFLDDEPKEQASPTATMVDNFLAVLNDIDETSQPGVGMGMDYRYLDHGHCGSALVEAEECVHFTLLAENPDEGYKLRRRHRMM